MIFLQSVFVKIAAAQGKDLGVIIGRQVRSRSRAAERLNWYVVEAVTSSVGHADVDLIHYFRQLVAS